MLSCYAVTGSAFVSIDLKHLGFPDFSMTKIFSNSPSTFTQNMAVIHSFNLFPPIHSVPLKEFYLARPEKNSAFVHVVNVMNGVTHSDIW